MDLSISLSRSTTTTHYNPTTTLSSCSTSTSAASASAAASPNLQLLHLLPVDSIYATAPPPYSSTAAPPTCTAAAAHHEYNSSSAIANRQLNQLDGSLALGSSRARNIARIDVNQIPSSNSCFSAESNCDRDAADAAMDGLITCTAAAAADGARAQQHDVPYNYNNYYCNNNYMMPSLQQLLSADQHPAAEGYARFDVVSRSCGMIKRERDVDVLEQQQAIRRDELVVDMDKVVNNYMTYEATSTSSRGTSVEDQEEGGRGGGGGRRKKLRLSKEQSGLLEESFKDHTTLNPKQKSALAKKLDLTPRQVEVWFQNRRARTKLKQTEADCELLKKCCESLTQENRRLHKEVLELRALNANNPSNNLVSNLIAPQLLVQRHLCPSSAAFHTPHSHSPTTCTSSPSTTTTAAATTAAATTTTPLITPCSFCSPPAPSNPHHHHRHFEFSSTNSVNYI